MAGREEGSTASSGAEGGAWSPQSTQGERLQEELSASDDAEADVCSACSGHSSLEIQLEISGQQIWHQQAADLGTGASSSSDIDRAASPVRAA